MMQWHALAEADRRETVLRRDERFTTRALRVENIDALDSAVVTWARRARGPR